jgi:hypothetical protein
MKAASITSVSRFCDPDAAKVGIKDLDYLIGDLFEAFMQAAVRE